MIVIPLVIWLTYMVWTVNRRIKRIDAFLMTRALKSKIDYVPDDETLAEARHLLELRERRRTELREMEDSDLSHHDQ